MEGREPKVVLIAIINKKVKLFYIMDSELAHSDKELPDRGNAEVLHRAECRGDLELRLAVEDVGLPDT